MKMFKKDKLVVYLPLVPSASRVFHSIAYEIWSKQCQLSL